MTNGDGSRGYRGTKAAFIGITNNNIGFALQCYDVGLQHMVPGFKNIYVDTLRGVVTAAVPEINGVTYKFLEEFAAQADNVDWMSKDALNKLYMDAKRRVDFNTP